MIMPLLGRHGKATSKIRAQRTVQAGQAAVASSPHRRDGLMTATKLIPVRMKKEHMLLPEVQAFRCGSKPHEIPLAEWIKVSSAEAIAWGWKVWLYRIQSDKAPLVGYGSFDTGTIETTEQDNSKKKVRGYEIPMLALHQDFWGCPKKTVDPEVKYSRQIVRHLQQQAQAAQLRKQLEPRERLLALYVHPDAFEAQKLYEDCGFTFAPGRFLPHPDAPPYGLLGMDFVWR
jgi:ribosomal protein S18 acetylase RimI-like enzyme